jgi:hypothetical protein
MWGSSVLEVVPKAPSILATPGTPASPAKQAASYATTTPSAYSVNPSISISAEPL